MVDRFGNLGVDHFGNFVVDHFGNSVVDRFENWVVNHFGNLVVDPFGNLTGVDSKKQKKFLQNKSKNVMIKNSFLENKCHPRNFNRIFNNIKI